MTNTRRVYSLPEAAKRVGVYPRSIIRSERRGDLPAPQRDQTGARVYSEADIVRLRGHFGR